MAGFGDNVENSVLDQVLRGTAYPYGTGTKLSLHTASPGDTGANEVVGGSYARQDGVWNAASGGISTLNAAVDFAGMPAVTVTHFGVWTAAGVFVGGGATTNRTMVAGDSYRLNATTTTISLD